MDDGFIRWRLGPGSTISAGFFTLLVLTFLIRAWRADQPIVENYVGRQIPTAMVARNLERGSGFFRPQLDTAPFPNYFVVEPPLYQLAVVNLRRATGLSLGAAGRIVSALAMTLGAWGLFDLVLPAAARGPPCWPPLPSRSFPSPSATAEPFNPTP